jgi:hypothetical protein
MDIRKVLWLMVLTVPAAWAAVWVGRLAWRLGETAEVANTLWLLTISLVIISCASALIRASRTPPS